MRIYDYKLPNIDLVFSSPLYGHRWVPNGAIPKLDDYFSKLDVAGTVLSNVEIVRTEDSYEYVIDVPGVDISDISVTFEKRLLTVEATRNGKKKIGAWNVDENYDIDSATATLLNGVLSVKLKRSENCKKKKLTVTMG